MEQSLRGELEQSLAAEASARKQAQELLEENARLSIAFKEVEARLGSSTQAEQAVRAELEAIGSVQAERGRELEGLREELDDTRQALAAASARAQEQRAVSAELRAQLTEARSRLAGIAEQEQRLREELTEARAVAVAAAQREVSLRLELDRAGQRIAALESSAAAAAVTDRAIPVAASVHRLEVPAPEDRDARDGGATGVAGAASNIAGLAGEELERLVLAAGEGRRPAGRELADGLRPDDLKAIGGVGPVNESWLHRNGIYFYAQIAQWTAEELAWVARHLPNFGKRVYRENWVRQAAELARPEVMPRQGKRLRADRH
jgi:predicted flap endonuclease-1-like 5' DNA nuclease/regulator of replication initiation timing